MDKFNILILFIKIFHLARCSPLIETQQKTFQKVLRQDYLTNVNDSVESWPDVDTLYRQVRYQPRHIHLAYGDNPFDIVVTWSTLDSPNDSVVEFGKKSISERRANGSMEEFISEGSKKLKQFIHRVTLTDLEPGGTYVYQCGSDQGWSSIFFFNAMQNGTDWSPSLVVYGDLGADNAQSLSQIQQEVQRGVYDAVLHVGDFAYDMETDDGLVGDVFMENIQSISGYLPYMTVPGNHERAQDFMQYKRRFTMPGEHDSMFYSFNMGSIHFVAINTEVYFELDTTKNSSVLEHYEWLRKDLELATKPEERNKRPWIILYGHRPMYCTSSDLPGCLDNTTPIRIGLPESNLPGLEDLLVDYGVDLAIWAHEHSYERFFPVYNLAVYNGSASEPYTNPNGLTHVISGSAGCILEPVPFPDIMPSWSAFRSTDYGYSRLNVVNSTHLYFEQVSIDQGNQVIDSFTLLRDRHESYGPFE